MFISISYLASGHPGMRSSPLIGRGVPRTKCLHTLFKAILNKQSINICYIRYPRVLDAELVCVGWQFECTSRHILWGTPRVY